MSAASSEPDDRKDQHLKDEEPFRRNAFLIIHKVLDLSENRPDLFMFVDEILHSIFFLGNINQPHYYPKDIVNDPEILEALRETYPRPFKCYASEVPRRSPFSCVLDMVVRVTGEGKERNIILQLRKIISEVDPSMSRKLVSSTICVSQKKNSSPSTRYYGVSMSTQRRQILIGASCLSNWDTYVANAVMTYYPHTTKKPYFDGTITIDENEVRCEAFDLTGRLEESVFVKPPCRSCGNLFGLATNASKEFTYGNCAEAESLSNLIKNEGVDGIMWFPMVYWEYTEKAQCQVERDLKSFLKKPQDIPITFYTPETEES